MQNDIPDWMKNLALKVHGLILMPNVLDRFHLMMQQWEARNDNQLKECEEWNASRRQCFKDLSELPDSDPLRTPSAVPPKENWVFENNKLLLSETIFGGWIEPSMSRTVEPKPETILPLGNRTLHLDEKYTLLAGVHDYTLKGVERISPWSTGSQESIAAIKDSIPYAVLLYGESGGLLKSIASFKHELGTFLTDVENDLKVNEPEQAGETAADTPVTLIEFMKMFCTPLTKTLLDSRLKGLQSAARRGEIELPKYEGKWKSGQGKKFRPTALVKVWPKCREKLPNLPELNLP